MHKYGFIRTAGAVPFNKVAGVEYNKNNIVKMIKSAYESGATIVVFPELSITSYTCQDLINHQTILEQSLAALIYINDETKELDILSIVGLPIANGGKLFNCAAVLNRGKILAIIPKSYVPGYNEFYENRWFAGLNEEYSDIININGEEVKFGSNFLFKCANCEKLVVGVEICEDLWTPIPPSSLLALSGATIVCNLSASDALVGKNEYRTELVKNQSARCISGYIYVSSGVGESTTDMVFDSDAMICENGAVVAESERFLRDDQIIYGDIDIDKLYYERLKINSFKNNAGYETIYFSGNKKDFELKRYIDSRPFVPSEKAKLDERCKEILNIQSAGLCKRMESIPGTKCVIGVSGGLDSTLALLVIFRAYKLLKINPIDIIAVTMKGYGTTDRTYSNVLSLCKKMGVTLLDIPITDISDMTLDKVNHSRESRDTCYENIQARARTYMLMTVANKYNGIVVGTGDLSEIALGWSTYNGDHISMYNVNSGVPKTLVKFLVSWASKNEYSGEISKILDEIVEQPISPELLPPVGSVIAQKTEDIIGPYELHDFFLYYFVRYRFDAKKVLFLAQKSFSGKYNDEEIKKVLKIFIKRFFQNQWKRDCVPAGVKVGSVDLSPRGSWRMPADADSTGFLDF